MHNYDHLLCNNYRGGGWSGLCSHHASHPAWGQCYHSCRLKGPHGVPLETEVRGHGGCGQWAEHEVIYWDNTNWTQSMIILLEEIFQFLMNSIFKVNWQKYHYYYIIFAGVGVVFDLRRGASPPVAVFWSVGSPDQGLGRHRQQRSS